MNQYPENYIARFENPKSFTLCNPTFSAKAWGWLSVINLFSKDIMFYTTDESIANETAKHFNINIIDGE